MMQRPDRLGGFFRRLERHQRRRLERMVGHRVIGHLGDETERTFRTDHQMGQDIDRIGEIDKGIERIAHRVLDGIFAPDQIDQFVVGPHFLGQIHEPADDIGPRLDEGFARGGIAAVEHRAVLQHQLEPVHGVIGVLDDAATHAGRVVVDHAADLGGVLTGRIGTDLAVERPQRRIGHRNDGRRPERHPVAALGDVDLAPTIAEHAQQPVGHRLAGQRGAGGAEGDVEVLGLGGGEHGGNLVLALDDDDNRRHQPEETGIARIGEGVERVGFDPLLRNDALEALGNRQPFSLLVQRILPDPLPCCGAVKPVWQAGRARAGFSRACTPALFPKVTDPT